MPSRRAVLAALLALGGCSRPDPSTPTATPASTSTPAETPYPAAVTDPLGDTRFDYDPPCPGAVPCFHRYSGDETPETIVVPDRERMTPDHPEATMATFNLGEEPLVLGTPARTFTWTDLDWAPTYAVDVPDDVVVLEPGETLERTVTMESLADGLHSVVEFGYFGEPRDPPTVRPDESEPRRLAGDSFRFGAMFEVEGSGWWPTMDDDVVTEWDGETLLLSPERAGDHEVVLELSDQTEGLPLVPETVAAHPPTKNAVLALNREGVERVRMPDTGVTTWYIENGLLFPRDLDPELTLRLDDLLFTVRLE